MSIGFIILRCTGHTCSILTFFFSFGPSEDCLDPMCSSHGICVKGECHCSTGWGGVNCETPLPICQEQCSGHGTFLMDTGVCSCDPKWTGSDCSAGRHIGVIVIFSSFLHSQVLTGLSLKVILKPDLYVFMGHKGLPNFLG